MMRGWKLAALFLIGGTAVAAIYTNPDAPETEAAAARAVQLLGAARALPVIGRTVDVERRVVEIVGLEARQVRGSALAVDQALKELGAKVSEREIRIELSGDILFDTGSAEVKLEAAATLEDVAAVIRANPQAAVSVEGHTDSQGDEKYNLALSEQRAKAVKGWLVEKGGIEAARLSTRGWGESRPIAANDTAEGRRKNRRVEVKLEKR